MLTFTLKNIGLIKETSLSLNEMTIICGKNNTGKTYITYSIYGFLHMWNDLIDFDISPNILRTLSADAVAKIDLRMYKQQKLYEILEKLSQRYTYMLPDVFSVGKEYFKDSKFDVKTDDNLPDKAFDTEIHHTTKNIEIHKNTQSYELIVSVLDKERIDISPSVIKRNLNRILGRLFFGYYFPEPFIITSERIGITLFYKELDIHRNVLVEQLAKKDKDFNPFTLFNKVVSRYAMPIQHNIHYTRDITDINKKQKSFLYDDKRINKYFSSFLNGKYKIEDETIYLVAQKSRAKIPIYFSSSATKSLLQLYFYILHNAEEGDILIIDEPELNLHQDNQLIMARLLNYLMHKGIFVFITTHSDYIIKEYTNLIRLKQPMQDKEKIIKKYKYAEDECLDHAKIRAYNNENGTLEKCAVDELGISIPPFDTVIDKLNSAMDDIYFSIDDEQTHDDTR